MAHLAIQFDISDLRRDAAESFTEPGGMQVFSQALHTIATSLLEDIPELKHVESIDRVMVSVSGGFTDNTVFGGDPADATGFMTAVVRVKLPDSFIAGYGDPGAPINTFITNLSGGLQGVSEALPNSGADFFSRIGMSDAATQVAVKVTITTFPGDA